MDDLNERNEVITADLKREINRNRDLLLQQKEDHDLIRELHEMGKLEQERLIEVEAKLLEESQARVDVETKYAESIERVAYLTELLRSADDPKSDKIQHERKLVLLQDDRSREKEKDGANKKLLDFMQEKLNRAYEDKDTLTERLNDERRKSEKDREELDSLREEISTMCDEAVSQKDEIEQLKKKIIASDQLTSRLQSELDTAHALEVDLKAQIVQRNHDFEQSKRLLEGEQNKLQEIEQEVLQDLTRLETELEETRLAVRQKEDRIVELEQTNQTLVKKEKEQAECRSQEEQQRKVLADRTVEADLEISHSKEVIHNLTKELDSLRVEHKKKRKRNEELESKLQSLTESSTTLETKLRKSEQDRATFVEKIEFQREELSREKDRCKQALKQLEDTTVVLRNTQTALDTATTKHQQEVSFLETRMINKETMMEKKCNYLKKMVEQARGQTDDRNYVREVQEELLFATKELEEVNVNLVTLNRQLVLKQQEIDQQSDKIRQIEEIMSSSSGTTEKVKKNRAVILEGLINEIFIECSVPGAKPSTMTDKEKSIQIVQRIRELSADYKRVMLDREDIITQVAELNAKINSTNSELATLRQLASSAYTSTNSDKVVSDVQKDLDQVKNALERMTTYVRQRIQDGTFKIDLQSRKDAHDVDFELDNIDNEVRAKISPLEQSLVEFVRAKKLMEEHHKNEDRQVFVSEKSSGVLTSHYAVQTDPDEEYKSMQLEIDTLQDKLAASKEHCKQYKELLRKFTLQMQQQQVEKKVEQKEETHDAVEEPVIEEKEAETSSDSVVVVRHSSRKKEQQAPTSGGGYTSLYKHQKKKK